jgi:hypothetical protein
MSEKITFEDVFNSDEGADWEIIDDTTYEVDDFNSKLDAVETEEEEEEEEEEESTDDGAEEEEEEEEDATEGDEDENLAAYMAKKWSDSGLITIPEGMEISSEDDLDKIIEHTVEEQVNNYKNSLSNTSKGFINFVEKGGNPSDYISIATKPDYSNINDDDEESKIEVIKELYKRKGLSSNRINTLVSALEDNAEIDEEFDVAKDFFKTEKESELERLSAEREASEALRQAGFNERDKSIKDLIKNSKEISDFPIDTKKAKDELTSYIFDKKVKYTDDNGNSYVITQYQMDKMERQKSKEVKFEDIIFDALYTKNKGKLTSVKKKGVTEHSQKFKELSKQYKQQSTASKLANGGGKNSSKGSKSKTSFDDWLALD